MPPSIALLVTGTVTSNASRHFKSPLAMGEMPFKIKRASSVPISVVIDTGVNSNGKILYQMGRKQLTSPRQAFILSM